MTNNFWKNKTVLITGHNGFKGCWLTKWLDMAGAKVVGLSLEGETDTIDNLELSENFVQIIGDITDINVLKELSGFKFDIVFHLAAQAIVKTAKEDPVRTFNTNVLGTVNLLQELRNQENLKAIVVVTSDKVYQNIETINGYVEDDPLMGSEAYSCSKVCEEQVTKAYYESFFKEMNVSVATARASNCFGGGDYHFDRLIPYLEECAYENKVPEIRNPESVRPWQYVLDLLHGYMTLAQWLYENDTKELLSYNFGPDDSELYTVGDMANIICGKAASGEKQSFYEAGLLFISSKKSLKDLGWKCIYGVESGLIETTLAYKKYFNKEKASVIYTECINRFEEKLEN